MRTFILTCIALLLMGNVNAQSAADLELAEMLNSGDMLRLNDRYPQIKDSLQVPMLARLAEANLYVNFNQLDKAEAAMADLFTHHQQELDAQTQIGMSALRAASERLGNADFSRSELLSDSERQSFIGHRF